MPADQTIADNATMAGGGGVDGADPSDQITITMVGLGDTPPKAYIKYATMWGLWSKRVGSSADDIAAREGIVAWVAGVQTGKDAIDIENVMNSEVKRNEVRIIFIFSRLFFRVRFLPYLFANLFLHHLFIY